NVALQSQFGQARFRGALSGSVWPWWRGGVALGWFGPLFWPYAYYVLFDYIYWPYAYDVFWPYAYDDLYYGIYGPYAYSRPYGYRPSVDPNGYYTRRSARRGVSSGHYAAANGTERAAEVCSDDAAQLTNWPIERISEVVQPTGAQRPALDGLRAANAKAIDMLKVRLPEGPAQHPDWTACGDGEPSAGHACGRADRAPGPRALLPIPQRRAESSVQRDRVGG